MPEVLRAIRGATTVEEDAPEQIRARTQDLVKEMLKRNHVSTDDIVSIIFTVTDDLVSAFPATAARELGLHDIPLLGAREVAVVGSTPRCIRVMMHCYSDRARKDIRHVFLEGAKSLRADLAE
jgi:chorismate mutase